MTLEAEPVMQSLEIQQCRHIKKVKIEPLTLSACPKGFNTKFIFKDSETLVLGGLNKVGY